MTSRTMRTVRLENDNERGRTHTIIPRDAVDCRVEKLRNRLPRALRAEPRTVGIVIHEWNLLPRLVRHIKVPLMMHVVVVSM
jgi:hypothetical protein